MDRTHSTRSGFSRITAGLALGAALLLASPYAATADTLSVEGTWLVQVTLRVCGSGSPLSSFNSLVTFGQGGTIAESPGSLGFLPGQRSPGHGTWSRLGPQTFSQRMVALILFGSAPNPPASPGFEAGGQMVTHTVELTSPDAFTSSGQNYFYRSNGELYRTGCSTAVGTRFK